jgi:O-antigen/teichoic acid export membrane protein
MCGSLIVDQGLSAFGAREIAKAPERTADLVREIVTARLLLAAVAYAAVSLFAVLYIAEPSIRNLVLIFGLSLWLLPFLLQWVFQGHDRMHFVSVTQVVRQLVFVSVVLIFTDGIEDLFVVGIAEVAAVGTTAALSVFIYLRVFPKHTSFTPALSLETMRSGGTIGLSQLFWVVKMFGATVIVGMIATAGETGAFAGAMRIFIALHTFVWLYFFNLLPSLSRAWQNEQSGFAKLIRDSMQLVLFVTIPGSIVGIVLAPYLMTVVYGPDFVAGTGALRWLGVACLLAAISGHFRFGLIAAGRQSLEMLSSAAGAAVVILLLPAGYFLGGITYAAFGLCVAEAVILLISWLQARPLLGARDHVGESRDTETLAGLPQSAR